MAAKIDVFNMALGLMGSGAFVASDTERSPEIVQLNLFYDTARRTVLRDFPYSFAQRRKNLAKTARPEEFADYLYAHALPHNALKVHYVTDSTANVQYLPEETDPKKYFRIVNNGGINILLSNLDPCIAEYTEDVSSLENADDSFIEMLSYKLAALVCIPLLKSTTNKVTELNQLYTLKLAQAMQNDASQKKTPKKIDTWVSTAKNY